MQNKYEGRTYEEALQKCLRTLELDETELYIDIKEKEPTEENKNKIEITVLPKYEVINYIKELIQNIGNALVSRIETKVSDVDDVLNCQPYCKRTRKDINEENIKVLAKVCKKYHFKVVLSSTWRELPYDHYMYLNLVESLGKYGIQIYSENRFILWLTKG